jgi:hypothetical protein
MFSKAAASTRIESEADTFLRDWQHPFRYEFPEQISSKKWQDPPATLAETTRLAA